MKIRPNWKVIFPKGGPKKWGLFGSLFSEIGNLLPLKERPKKRVNQE